MCQPESTIGIIQGIDDTNFILYYRDPNNPEKISDSPITTTNRTITKEQLSAINKDFTNQIG